MDSSRNARSPRASSKAKFTHVKHHSQASLVANGTAGRDSFAEAALNSKLQYSSSRRARSVQLTFLAADFSARSILRSRKDSVAELGEFGWPETAAPRDPLLERSSFAPSDRSTRRGGTADIKRRLLHVARSPSVDAAVAKSNLPPRINSLHPTTEAADTMNQSRSLVAYQDPLRVPFEEQRAVYPASSKGSLTHSGAARLMSEKSSLDRSSSTSNKKSRRAGISPLSIFNNHKAISSLRAASPKPSPDASVPSKEVSSSIHSKTVSLGFHAGRSRSANDLAMYGAPANKSTLKPARLKPRDNDSSSPPRRQTRKIVRGGAQNWFDGIDISSDEEHPPATKKLSSSTIAFIRRRQEADDPDSWTLDSRRPNRQKPSNPQIPAGTFALSAASGKGLQTQSSLKARHSTAALTITGMSTIQNGSGRRIIADCDASQIPEAWERYSKGASPVVTSGTIPIKLGSQVIESLPTPTHTHPEDLTQLRRTSANRVTLLTKPPFDPQGHGNAHKIARTVPLDAAHMMAVTEEEMILLESIRHKRAAKQLNAGDDVYHQISRRRESMRARMLRTEGAMRHMDASLNNTLAEMDGQSQGVYSLLQQEHIDTARNLERYFALSDQTLALHSPHAQPDAPGIVLQPTVYKAISSVKTAAGSIKSTKSLQTRKAHQSAGSISQPRRPKSAHNDNKIGRSWFVSPTKLFVEEAIPECPGPPPTGPLPQEPKTKPVNHRQSLAAAMPQPSSDALHAVKSLARHASDPERKLMIKVPEAFPKRSNSHPLSSVAVTTHEKQDLATPLTRPCSSPVSDDSTVADHDATTLGSRSQSVSTLQDPTIDSPDSVTDRDGLDCYILPTGSFENASDDRKRSVRPISTVSVNSMGQEILDAWADLGGGRVLV